MKTKKLDLRVSEEFKNEIAAKAADLEISVAALVIMALKEFMKKG